ncbi:MAG: PP2C family protein-serine/threonine phosphatase [Halothece sp.]
MDVLITKDQELVINEFSVTPTSYLGQLATGVDYFEVTLQSSASEETTATKALLRIASTEGALNRELTLRESIGEYKLIGELITYSTEESIILDTQSFQKETNLENSPPDTSSEEDDDYLEEEYYEEKPLSEDLSSSKYLVLTHLPNPEESLETWLQEEQSLENALALASQICQFCRYLYQQGWCLVDLAPQLVQMGTPIQICDLTNVYPLDETLSTGFLGNYSAPELSYSDRNLNQLMSSYMVSALLYQTIYHHSPTPYDLKVLEEQPIPKVYQILKIGLSHVPEERFPLNQLLNLLVQTRQNLRVKKYQWSVASASTVGLSTSRLTNEDNYGVRQHQLATDHQVILAVVADGMGGTSQGEVASQTTVETILNEPIPPELNSPENWQTWLNGLVEKANFAITEKTKEGGTTCSLVGIKNDQLMIAHVGDSRIWLQRNGYICQLSEDHSMVAMLLASGQITYEETFDYPERGVLTRSLGSKSRLSPNYIQNLQRFGEKNSLSLQDGDIIFLCSDGVWDLVSATEIAEKTEKALSLQSAVDEVMELIFQRGASDNATLLALQLSCHSLNYC